MWLNYCAERLNSEIEIRKSICNTEVTKIPTFRALKQLKDARLYSNLDGQKMDNLWMASNFSLQTCWFAYSKYRCCFTSQASLTRKTMRGASWSCFTRKTLESEYLCQRNCRSTSLKRTTSMCSRSTMISIARFKRSDCRKADMHITTSSNEKARCFAFPTTGSNSLMSRNCSLLFSLSSLRSS